VVLVLPVVLVALAIPALCIWAAVDAAGHPDWAFEAAGTSKTLWIVLPIAGLFVCVLGVVAAIMWLTTYKGRVENAARGGSGLPPRVA
jgi:hypothetical protein